MRTAAHCRRAVPGIGARADEVVERKAENVAERAKHLSVPGHERARLDALLLGVLGEGAAYRVIGDIAPVRITRPALKTSHSLRQRAAGEAKEAYAGLDGAPLELRMQADLRLVHGEIPATAVDR